MTLEQWSPTFAAQGPGSCEHLVPEAELRR